MRKVIPSLCLGSMHHAHFRPRLSQDKRRLQSLLRFLEKAARAKRDKSLDSAGPAHAAPSGDSMVNESGEQADARHVGSVIWLALSWIRERTAYGMPPAFSPSALGLVDSKLSSDCAAH